MVLMNGAHHMCCIYYSSLDISGLPDKPVVKPGSSQGKGRKMRCTPLRPDVVAVLRAWIEELKGNVADPLFPSLRGGPLSADAVQRLVAKHANVARRHCPSFIGKTITPHTLRHAAESL